MLDTALVIMELQNDFMPWGSFPIKDAHSIIPFINTVTDAVYNGGGKIISVFSEYPEDYSLLKSNGGFLDLHCMSGSYGRLPVKGFKHGHVFWKSKGFSAFDIPEFCEFVKSLRKLIIVGVPFEYSVRMTAFDAVKRDFKVRILTDGVRAYNPENTETQVRDLIQHGVEVV